MSINKLEAALRAAVRRAAMNAIDDGMRGRDVVRLLQSEVDRLNEAVPAMTRRHVSAVTARIAARHGE